MFFYIGRFVMGIGMHLLYRVKSEGAERVPREGGFVLCANHLHAMDPVMLAICMRRRMYFMAKKELFENWFTGFFLRALGAFPVDRAASDMKSYKKAISLLNEGKPLLVFTQGTRAADFTQAKNGAAMFALKTGVPVVPACISGTYKRFSTVRIHYGEPIPTADANRKVNSERVNALTAEIVAAVKELAV